MRRLHILDNTTRLERSAALAARLIPVEAEASPTDRFFARCARTFLTGLILYDCNAQALARDQGAGKEGR